MKKYRYASINFHSVDALLASANNMGHDGWRMVSAFWGNDGLIAFFEREID